MQVLSETVTAYGRVQADADQVASITLPRAGLVGRLWVRLGQRVSAGQQLLELDTAPSARMEYQQAQAAVDFAQSKLQHLQDLYGEKLATRDQMARAEKDLRDAQAHLEAQRKLGTGQAKEVIRAPFAGIITKLSVNQGQRVQADTAALLLARGQSLVVPLGLEQEDAHRVQAGFKVRLSSVFRPGSRVDSQVREVHAMVDPKTRLVDVLVPIPESEADNLVLNETMRGTITLKQEQALSVPRSAVLRDEKGAYVFVVRNGHAHRVAVTTGNEQGDRLAVSGKLNEGDPIVTVGNYELQDGMSVREPRP